MNVDSTFRIGSMHSVCQDYAVAINNDNPFVILSDGCSSSPDTDTGARLLVKAAVQLSSGRSSPDISELHLDSACLALRWAELIGVPAQSVDATLMSIHQHADELIVACSGDGAIVLESQGGALDLHLISSPAGYPFYPSYVHQPDRLQELLEHGRSSKQLQHFRRLSAEEPLSLIETSTSASVTEVLRVKAAEYRYVAVISDGLNSFFSSQASSTGKRTEVLSPTEVLPELWAFKNSHGAFVARRMKRFKKDCESKAWHHGDDLAVAAIYLGD